MKAPNTAMATPMLVLALNTFIAKYEPTNIKATLTPCSITSPVVLTVINFCPCKYPRFIAKYGTISKQKEFIS